MAKRQATEIKGQAGRVLEQDLNREFANMQVLYVKLHNYHWFVKGSHFFSLHGKFEELYNKTATFMDDYAEQMLAIQVKPLATMKDFLANATIEEASGNEDEQEMVETLAADLQALSNQLVELVDGLEEQNALSLADSIQGMARDFQKDGWMLRSYLGRD
ncbi:DNA starvation/stationary phase protection protein [Salicibibacter halophilus]|uniref:DNA starvation/stationary phase protection protein n=1 Tax=Salicibibacter halophilus TaxID=2502791 RepID=A0A514LF35_9BACI|nr:DNA starvation/stationary phase protection protein [Salicibibacter halophilus]QDI90175.1 DNA starvation/stationary phase protection protein [Salicibibacter halophilus]